MASARRGSPNISAPDFVASDLTFAGARAWPHNAHFVLHDLDEVCVVAIAVHPLSDKVVRRKGTPSPAFEMQNPGTNLSRLFEKIPLRYKPSKNIPRTNTHERLIDLPAELIGYSGLIALIHLIIQTSDLIVTMAKLA